MAGRKQIVNDTAPESIVMTPNQVAERWGITARTVRDMLAAGTLHGFKAGTCGKKAQWRVLASEVMRFERGKGSSQEMILK